MNTGLSKKNEKERDNFTYSYYESCKNTMNNIDIDRLSFEITLEKLEYSMAMMKNNLQRFKIKEQPKELITEKKPIIKQERKNLELRWNIPTEQLLFQKKIERGRLFNVDKAQTFSIPSTKKVNYTTPLKKNEEPLDNEEDLDEITQSIQEYMLNDVCDTAIKNMKVNEEDYITNIQTAVLSTNFDNNELTTSNSPIKKFQFMKAFSFKNGRAEDDISKEKNPSMEKETQNEEFSDVMDPNKKYEEAITKGLAAGSSKGNHIKQLSLNSSQLKKIYKRSGQIASSKTNEIDSLIYPTEDKEPSISEDDYNLSKLLTNISRKTSDNKINISTFDFEDVFKGDEEIRKKINMQKLEYLIQKMENEKVDMKSTRDYLGQYSTNITNNHNVTFPLPNTNSSKSESKVKSKTNLTRTPLICKKFQEDPLKFFTSPPPEIYLKTLCFPKLNLSTSKKY